MLLLYRIGLWMYWVVILLASPVNGKARKFRSGREKWKGSLQKILEGNQAPIAWFHAASLGEFEQGRPVMEALKKVRPDVKIMLTFFSPSGYEIRKDYAGADWVIYLPMDSPSNARKFISTLKPVVAVFVKYEFWYYYLRELHNQKIPVMMISCILRENHFFFTPSGKFFHKVLKPFAYFFMQDGPSMDRLKSLGISQASVSGDTRFDRVLNVRQQARDIPIALQFKNDEKVMVIGSSWDSDISVLTGFIHQHLSELKFIIAPHNLHEQEIQALQNTFEKTARFSQTEGKNLADYRILIVDNMGMLSSLYAYGDYAYIGGGFRGALHNTLEAAVYGIPVFFGEHENNKKFIEAMGLLAVGGAFSIRNGSELTSKFDELFHDDKAYTTAAQAAGNYVLDGSGATEKVMQKLTGLLP
jgi:3-deoxy-D-manno-octulosonic-acid transferase